MENDGTHEAIDRFGLARVVRNWLIGFVVWTLIGLSFAIRSYVNSVQAGTGITWQDFFSAYLIDFYVIGAASPVIFYLCRRFPIERGRIFAGLGIHFISSIVFTFTVYPVSLLAVWYFGYPNLQETPTLAAWMMDNLLHPFFVHQTFIAYWATLGVAQAYEYHRQAQISKTQLAQAQLSALKMQIHPHFLFNTLNSINSLLHKDVEAAERMIARLSDFLRLTLNSSNASIVTLEEELEFLRNYLEIEKIRFRDRLVVEMRIDPEVLTARVPYLILQPLVENAVRHGISMITDVGKLAIRAKTVEDRLLIEIEDNGPGLQKQNGDLEAETDGGVGLTNTRARLRQFANGDYRFDISNKRENAGTVIRIDIPCIV